MSLCPISGHDMSRALLGDLEDEMGKRHNTPKPTKTTASRPEFVMERFGVLKASDRSFDIEFWQRQGDAAIFQAAWELAESYHLDEGMMPDELRLQRTVEHFKRK